MYKSTPLASAPNSNQHLDLEHEQRLYQFAQQLGSLLDKELDFMDAHYGVVDTPPLILYSTTLPSSGGRSKKQRGGSPLQIIRNDPSANSQPMVELPHDILNTILQTTLDNLNLQTKNALRTNASKSVKMVSDMIVHTLNSVSISKYWHQMVRNVIGANNRVQPTSSSTDNVSEVQRLISGLLHKYVTSGDMATAQKAFDDILMVMGKHGIDQTPVKEWLLYKAKTYNVSVVEDFFNELIAKSMRKPIQTDSRDPYIFMDIINLFARFSDIFESILRIAKASRGYVFDVTFHTPNNDVFIIIANNGSNIRVVAASPSGDTAPLLTQTLFEKESVAEEVLETDDTLKRFVKECIDGIATRVTPLNLVDIQISVTSLDKAIGYMERKLSTWIPEDYGHWTGYSRMNPLYYIEAFLERKALQKAVKEIRAPRIDLEVHLADFNKSAQALRDVRRVA